MDKYRSAALISGFLSGLSGLVVFLVVHAWWIVPIWFVVPIGVPIAGLGGLAVGWAYAELGHGLPLRQWRTLAVAAGVSLILLPSILIAELRPPMFIVSGSGIAVLMTTIPEAVLRFITDLLIPAAISGGVLGVWLGRTKRAALVTTLAALTLALGPGHNIPFLGNTPGVGKEILIIVLVNLVSALTLVEVHARLSSNPRLSGVALHVLTPEERHTP